MSGARPAADFRYARIGELGGRTRKALKRAVPLLGVLLGGYSLYRIFSGRGDGYPLLLITLGSCIALAVWKKRGEGLPLMPMIVLQHVVVYALPLLVAQDSLTEYTADEFMQAGIELLVFFLVLTITWSMGMRMFRRPRPFCYGLREFSRGEGGKKLAVIGFSLIAGTTLYQVLERTDILGVFLAMLPSGVSSILWAVLSAAGTCGFFIVALLVGGRGVSAAGRGVFWALLALNCYIGASGFLLSSAVIVVVTVTIGLFWSSGRVPWLYLMVVLAIFSFLNIGKVVMREKYWGPGGADDIPEFSFSEMPAHYLEWIGASFDQIMAANADKPAGVADFSDHGAAPSQNLLQRINNMQNLLFVIDAVDRQHVAPLHGESYAIIPKLLIPRFLWPGKPGTHEGQAMLNVHFGRQDLESTTTTYIAWGLLPEAYGNFGAILGSVFLGAVLGFLFAWIERYTANKLVISIEGFVAFTVFLALANSFELVASVLVTAVEQSIIPIVIATAPFAHRVATARPAPRGGREG